MRHTEDHLSGEDLVSLCKKLTKNQTDVFAQYLAKSRKAEKLRKHITMRNKHDEVALFASRKHRGAMHDLRIQLMGILENKHAQDLMRARAITRIKRAKQLNRERIRKRDARQKG